MYIYIIYIYINIYIYIYIYIYKACSNPTRGKSPWPKLSQSLFLSFFLSFFFKKKNKSP